MSIRIGYLLPTRERIHGRNRQRHRVDIGTAVLLATLDQVADGRLILGVGIVADVPNIRHEFTAAGVPYEKRVVRFNTFDSNALLTACWLTPGLESVRVAT